VLVAASDYGIQTGAFLGALWAGQAAPLLLAWGGRPEASSVTGQAFLGPLAARVTLHGAADTPLLHFSDTPPGTHKSPLGCTPSPPGTKPLGPVLKLRWVLGQSPASDPRWTKAQHRRRRATIPFLEHLLRARHHMEHHLFNSAVRGATSTPRMQA